MHLIMLFHKGYTMAKKSSKLSTNDVYEAIVESFKEELINKGNPFEPVSEPYNLESLRKYSGFNRWHLSGIVREKKYTTSCFASYKQIAQKGGQIRKGEKGYPIFFWGTLYIYKGDIVVSASNQEQAYEKAKKKSPSLLETDLRDRKMFMKHFTAFNLDQADDIDIEDENTVTSLDYLIDATGSNLVNGPIAQYHIETDTLDYPEFPDEDDKGMILKSIVETTGHETRLNREFSYQEENLISTIGASFLAKSVGIVDINYDESLVDRWLEILDENPMFLYKAATQAQKAIELLSDSINHFLVAKAS